MDAIKSLSEKFAHTKPNHVFALRCFRPHPGVFFETGEVDLKPEQTMEEAMAEANTNGIDIMIIVLRHLRSFDFGITDLRDGQGLETVGNTLLSITDKDMGWVQEEDWKIKQYIVRELVITYDITFQDLFSLPSLENLFRQNAQFRVIDSILPKGEGWIKLEAWSAELVEKNTLRFESSKPLAQSLTDYFDPDLGRQYLSLRPRFLLVQYHVTFPQPISKLYTLSIRAPEVRKDNGMIKGIQEGGYRLCLVIRMTVGKEKVKVYEVDGDEVYIAPIGNVEAKKEKDTNWSIEEAGDYLLFYVRICM